MVGRGAPCPYCQIIFGMGSILLTMPNVSFSNTTL